MHGHTNIKLKSLFMEVFTNEHRAY